MLISSLGTRQAGLEIIETLQGEHRLLAVLVGKVDNMRNYFFLECLAMLCYDDYVYLYHHIPWYKKCLYTSVIYWVSGPYVLTLHLHVTRRWGTLDY